MVRTLKITAVCAAACGVLAVPALAQQPDPKDPTALVETAQSKPVKVNRGDTHTVVGQAAITAGGSLIVRLAAPNQAGVDGEDVIAQTRKVVDDEFSGDVTKAHLSIRLKSNRTGTVKVIGPDNSSSPDSAVYKLRWSVTKPSIRIVGVGV